MESIRVWSLLGKNGRLIDHAKWRWFPSLLNIVLFFTQEILDIVRKVDADADRRMEDTQKFPESVRGMTKHSRECFKRTPAYKNYQVGGSKCLSQRSVILWWLVSHCITRDCVHKRDGKILNSCQLHFLCKLNTWGFFNWSWWWINNPVVQGFNAISTSISYSYLALQSDSKIKCVGA